MNLSGDDLQQRAEADRRGVDPPIRVETASWSTAGQLDWWVKDRQAWWGGRVRAIVQIVATHSNRQATDRDVLRTLAQKAIALYEVLDEAYRERVQGDLERRGRILPSSTSAAAA